MEGRSLGLGHGLLGLLGLEEHVVGVVDLLVEVALVLEQALDVDSGLVDDHAGDLGGVRVAEDLLDRRVHRVAHVSAARVARARVNHAEVGLGHGDHNEGWLRLRHRLGHGLGLRGLGHRHRLGHLLLLLEVAVVLLVARAAAVVLVVLVVAAPAAALVAAGALVATALLLVPVVVPTALVLVVPVLPSAPLVTLVLLRLLLIWLIPVLL